MEADVLGVVADSAPGEGVSISAIMAEGDSDDIMLGGSVSQRLSSKVVGRGVDGKCWWLSWWTIERM